MASPTVRIAQNPEHPVGSMEVIISILVEDPALRQRCKHHLAGPAGIRRLGALPLGSGLSYEVNHENRPDEAAELLKLLFQAPGRVVIVISDLAGEFRRTGASSPNATSWWNDLTAALGEDQTRLGSVAITDWAPMRVPEVDRAVGTDVDERALLDAIASTIRTLDYKQKPRRRNLDGLVQIRHVRSTEDLESYYALRHRIYSVMGYLDHEVETRVSNKLEIDWCDLFSIPIAAFVEEPDGATRTVGTARIIGTREYAPQLSKATKALADGDESGILTQKLRKGYPFQMPFLQSHPDPELLGELNAKFPDRFCEISRVVVDRDHRGMGVSRLLMAYAMTVARRMGMMRIFLECLPAHRKLYESFRFQIVPGRRDRVYNINKTMDLMEWEGPVQPFSRATSLLAQAELNRLRKSGYLCLCTHRDCPTGSRESATAGERVLYGRFLQWPCPMAARPAPSHVIPEDQHLYRQWPGMETYYDYAD